MAQKTLINLGAYVSYDSMEGTPFEQSGIPEASLEDLRTNFADWEPEIQDFLQVRTIVADPLNTRLLMVPVP